MSTKIVGDAVLSKWFIVNALWVALVGAAWHQGWVEYVYTKDITYISHGITVGLIIMLAVSALKAFRIREFFRISDSIRETYVEDTTKEEADRSDIREALQTELVANIAGIDKFSIIALSIGVLGTVVGLILGFSHVDPASISEVSTAGVTVAGVLKGLAVAFHTTLVGGIASLWLRMNHDLLMQASSILYAKILRG